MGNLKEIRNRIASIKTTRQVTNAMKMVSAAKLKKAQDVIIKFAPYDKRLRAILENLGQSETNENRFIRPNQEPESILIVVVGSNKGLCGAFNANVSKSAIIHIFDNYSYQLRTGKLNLLLIGKQLEKHFRTIETSIMGEAHELINKLSFESTAEISDMLMDKFSTGSYQRIDIIYNKFKNAAVQILSCEQFLPVVKPQIEESETSIPDYLFEPSQNEILDTLIPTVLRTHLYRIMLDSNAAEQGARMTAMHQATDNATELMKELKTTYNNARQAAITNEIMEITAGAEALRKSN